MIFLNPFINFLSRIYYHGYYKFRLWQLRRQKTISVVFRLENLGAWKTESLYRLMLEHPRFAPLLVVSRNYEEDDREKIIAYCKMRGYCFEEFDVTQNSIWSKYQPDIMVFQKPYCTPFSSRKERICNLKTLFLYIPYAFHGAIESWSINTPYLRKCWQIYYENEPIAKEYGKLLPSKNPNSYATGLPLMDDLIKSPDNYPDSWKPASEGKKRIIYAPHHSIDPENWWQSSTFLETGEAMLELAKNYSDKVQWVFKPHPLLRGKLEKIWGKEKTQQYYGAWSEPEWSQYESGEYMGIFMHSDAMIHDCGSFIMEYLYTGNPVMYLMKTHHLSETFNSNYKKALALHYHGWNMEEVEQFIKDVIDGKDSRKPERDNFMHHFMTPKGASACQNIIDCILDGKKSKEFLVSPEKK